MKTYLDLNGEWKIHGIPCKDNSSPISLPNSITAFVPGDIHNDLMRAGILKDPYYADNIYACDWVTGYDWEYTKEFQVDQNTLQGNCVLCLFGIDTIADVKMNGQFLGRCENMFLAYRFPLKDVLQPGPNILKIRIHSPTLALADFKGRSYSGAFNNERIYLRKAQCHFSWDWAPNIPGLGIWQDVGIESFTTNTFDNVFIHGKANGEVVVDFTLREQQYSDILHRFKLEIIGNGKTIMREKDCLGLKNFFALTVESPRLWWPNGLGEPYMYSYRLTLIENQKISDIVEGQFGFRDVKVKEFPKSEEEGLGFTFYINDQPVFFKGCNWVPLDLMTGRIPEEKYDHILNLAHEAGINCLRVWGGGIYEKNIFYRLCDELGILVWQDFAFSCSDIPDGYPKLEENILAEAVYQVRRLRNHPCIIAWCGGNERNGSFETKSFIHTSKIVDYLIQGICAHEDSTRPFFPSSPWSHTDVENDQTSGDSHCNSYQMSMEREWRDYHETLSSFTASLVSEIAVQGSPTIYSLKKYIPEDKLWPINSLWDLHFCSNPYDGTGLTFAQQQKNAVDSIFGPADSLDAFVWKSMAVHMECVKAEMEYHLSRAWNCSGTLLWMYNDIWPCGTWSIVDYYLEPKAAYYALKRLTSPIMPVITLRNNEYHAYIVNSQADSITGHVILGGARVNGEILYRIDLGDRKIAPFISADIHTFQQDTTADYLFIQFESQGRLYRNHYFIKPWQNIQWQNPHLHTVITPFMIDNAPAIKITMHAEMYARMVTITVPSQELVLFSDNYFDLEPYEKKTIVLRSNEILNPDKIQISHWFRHFN